LRKIKGLKIDCFRDAVRVADRRREGIGTLPVEP